MREEWSLEKIRWRLGNFLLCEVEVRAERLIYASGKTRGGGTGGAASFVRFEMDGKIWGCGKEGGSIRGVRKAAILLVCWGRGRITDAAGKCIFFSLLRKLSTVFKKKSSRGVFGYFKERE
jgi:hypothetical protein